MLDTQVPKRERQPFGVLAYGAVPIRRPAVAYILPDVQQNWGVSSGCALQPRGEFGPSGTFV
jgi:hypothetical protein